MKKILMYSEKLKHLFRTGWVREGINNPETVASHSWQMAIMALYLSEKKGDQYDFNKVIKLCLCHDLAESIIGDITPQQEKYKEKGTQEKQAMVKIAAECDFPEAVKLFDEYEKNITPEAQLANDLDKLDMYAQAVAYEQKFPHKDLSEFKISAVAKIQTPLGKAILKEFAE